MHMKKTFLLLLLVSTLLFACSKSDFTYDNWNKIEISGCGSIEIPDKWSHFYEDGMLYIIDENAKPVIIQCDNYKIYEGDSNKFYSNYRKIECVYNESFSNSSSYEISKFLFDNTCNLSKEYGNLTIEISHSNIIIAPKCLKHLTILYFLVPRIINSNYVKIVLSFNAL